MPTEIHILSAGAIEPGLIAAIGDYLKHSGQFATISWATTPEIQRRIAGGDRPDVVIAARAAMDSFDQEGLIAGEHRVRVGGVGVGVMVREGAPVPDVSSVAALKAALLDADSIVFNRASSGLYVESLLGTLGILETVRSRSVRHENGPEMMEHVMNGRGREIGFCAIVEILLYGDRGVTFVGPLPPQIQHHTEYVAAVMIEAPDPAGARAFVHYLGTPAAKGLFAAHGVE